MKITPTETNMMDNFKMISMKDMEFQPITIQAIDTRGSFIKEKEKGLEKNSS